MKTYAVGALLVASSWLMTGCLSDRIPNRTLEERMTDARRAKPKAGEVSISVPVSTPDFERYQEATGVVAKMFSLGRGATADGSVYVVVRIHDADTGVTSVRVWDRGFLRYRRGDNALVVNYPTSTASSYVFGGTVIDSPPLQKGADLVSVDRFSPEAVLSSREPGSGLVLPKYTYERIFIDGYTYRGKSVSVECCVIEGAGNADGLTMSEVLTSVLRALEQEPVAL